MSDAKPSPLYQLLNEINRAASAGCYLVSIAMATALPDICAALAAANGRTTKQLYKEWCQAHLNDHNFRYITPDDMYSIRCGVLHQGRFGDLQHSVARVIFLMGGHDAFVDCKINDAYFYSAGEFCSNICEAAYRWFEANRDDPVVASNISRMMTVHPQGLAPYVMGMPVIA